MTSGRLSGTTLVGGAFAALALLCAAAGLLYTPYDPAAVDPLARLAAPSSTHWFGTDQYGRDLFSRMLAAGSVTIGVSLFATGCAVAIGGGLGACVAYLGGAADRVAMLVNDALMAFPAILMALALMAVLGPGIAGVIVALTVAFAPMAFRVVRATVLGLRGREFVEASMLAGHGHARTLVRHVLPNCIAPVTVLATSVFGLCLLTESALSFLGLGVPPPAATWGGLLADGRSFATDAAWLGWFPGLFICVALLGANLLGDALRDRLDPRMRAST